MSSSNGSVKSIIGALVANVSVATVKFIAAAITGSSAMLSEGIHSVVDSINVMLILFGHKRSQMPPSDKHPFGYGMEIYFWTLVVAISLFAVGGGMAIYEGIVHIQNPEPLENPMWNYIVLGAAIVFNGVSWWIAFKEFSKSRKEKSLWSSISNSKDPAVFAILFEDTADILGVIVAFLGVYLGHQLQDPRIDGFASIVIGLILCVTSAMLAYESKSLLIGESADSPILQDIVKLCSEDASVVNVRTPLSMHLGPQDIMLALGIRFSEKLSSDEVALAINRIEHQIKQKYPEVKRIFIEAKDISSFSK
jgi:cation diffusion facilitator family transporter